MLNMSVRSGFRLSHSRTAPWRSSPRGYAAQNRSNISGSQSGTDFAARFLRLGFSFAPSPVWGTIGGVLVLLKLVFLCVGKTVNGFTVDGFSVNG